MNYQTLFEQAGLQQFKTVSVGGLGDIRIKKRSAADVLAKEKLLFDAQQKKDSIEPLRIAMLDVRLCVVDDDGKPFLTEAQVAALPSEMVYEIYAHINDLSSTISAASVDDAAKKS